jgi:hypothetical protein
MPPSGGSYREGLAAKTAHLQEPLAQNQGRDRASQGDRGRRRWSRPLSRYRSAIPIPARWRRADRVPIVGCNVQVAVDTEHHLIMTHERTKVGSDVSQLSHMAKEMKARLQTDIVA